jgi:hypothetical protein
VIPGTSVTLGVTFDRVAGEVRRSEDRPTLRFDSAAPAPAPPAAADPADEEAARFHRGREPLLALVGKSIEATWEESGKYLRFGGLEGLREAMAGKRDAEDPFRAAVDQIASVLNMHDLLRPHLVVGERSLRPDDPRTFQDMGLLPETVGGPGLVYYRGTYRLKEVVEGVARVEMEADCSLDPYPQMPVWPPQAAEFRSRLRLERGTCRAWERIETATGRLLEDEHVTDLDLRWLPPDGSKEIPIPAKRTRRMKLLR